MHITNLAVAKAGEADTIAEVVHVYVTTLPRDSKQISSIMSLLVLD